MKGKQYTKDGIFKEEGEDGYGEENSEEKKLSVGTGYFLPVLESKVGS